MQVAQDFELVGGRRRRLHEFRRHAQIGDELGRPLGLEAEPGAVIAALPVSERGDEVELGDKAALALPHRDEDFTAAIGDLGSAARPGEPHRRFIVGADHDRVQVGEAVDLRAAEKSDGDAAALKPVLEHFRHGHGGKRRVAQFAVADRERQHVRLGLDRTRFVDQPDSWRVGEPGEIARRRRQVDSYEAYIA
jgi:hypothetical protein